MAATCLMLSDDKFVTIDYHDDSIYIGHMGTMGNPHDPQKVLLTLTHEETMALRSILRCEIEDDD